MDYKKNINTWGNICEHMVCNEIDTYFLPIGQYCF